VEEDSFVGFVGFFLSAGFVVDCGAGEVCNGIVSGFLEEWVEDVEVVST
jgi:hypothetical protein